MQKIYSDIGLIGLAVMGQNLALNIADHGYTISLYNRTLSKTENFIKNHTEYSGLMFGYDILKKFTKSVQRPRKIIILVKSGLATDGMINKIIPFLEEQDIIIDGGNANWHDTNRRELEINKRGILFIGCGISGGEKGARLGPSLMSGGNISAWRHIKPICMTISAKISAKTGKEIIDTERAKASNEEYLTCSAYIGPGGSGHYVKMIHNGIEYADIQVICESYDIMKNILKMTNEKICKSLNEWNKSILSSFLIEATIGVLSKSDVRTGTSIVEYILDSAEHKMTGQWAAKNAMDMNVPAQTIAESVFARYISSRKKERTIASSMLNGPTIASFDKRNTVKYLTAIKDSLYCSKICYYSQGYQLMYESQKKYNWRFNFRKITQIWQGGCIIKSGFLQQIIFAYRRNSALVNLLFDPFFAKKINELQHNWRMIIILATSRGISLPVMSSSLSYFDAYRTSNSPHNLLQGLRDFFGSHKYKRIDSSGENYFHAQW